LELATTTTLAEALCSLGAVGTLIEASAAMHTAARKGDAAQGELLGRPYFTWRIIEPSEILGALTPMLDEILRSMLEERAAASMVEDELSLPVSRERFLTNPIHAR
jgi:hypothetical protein